MGFISYFNSLKKIILYLIFISIVIELLHLYIPNRSFQFSDLFGNIGGVLISIGSSNPYNMVRATIDALSKIDSPRQVAARRNKKVSEVVSKTNNQEEASGEINNGK